MPALYVALVAKAVASLAELQRPARMRSSDWPHSVAQTILSPGHLLCASDMMEPHRPSLYRSLYCACSTRRSTAALYVPVRLVIHETRVAFCRPWSLFSVRQ